MKKSQDFIRFCLDVAYMGTYLCAALAGRIMTLVGCGVFGNPITDAILRAHLQYGVVECVTLAMYHDQTSEISDLLQCLRNANVEIF